MRTRTRFLIPENVPSVVFEQAHDFFCARLVFARVADEQIGIGTSRLPGIAAALAQQRIQLCVECRSEPADRLLHIHARAIAQGASIDPALRAAAFLHGLAHVCGATRPVPALAVPHTNETHLVRAER